MNPARVFQRSDVPGIGVIEVFADGRTRLDGDLEMNRTELRDLLEVITEANAAIDGGSRRPLRRAPQTTSQLEQLADANG